MRKESAFLNPIILGISTGVSILFGALFTSGFIGRIPGILLPRTALPSFLHILFQLMAYAVIGAAFAALLNAPPCQRSERFRWLKKCGLLLFICTLVLCYIWIPLICKAGSYFLGTLLCGIIFIALIALFFISYRISIISAGLLVLFSLWMLYILYITLSFLLFC
jgi:tryptophan-rich sensory protein